VRNERTFVGLDVHARSVSGHGVDVETGQGWQRKLCPDPTKILGWVQGFPGPVSTVYEAGPTGYGLFRYLGPALWPGHCPARSLRSVTRNCSSVG